jgi:hypothetical protein
MICMLQFSEKSHCMNRTIRCLVLLALLVGPLNASADAIVRSMAMFASTIAEYYVEEDRIRVELEIGEVDIPVFRNLLPDEIHQQLGFGDQPFEERIELFFLRDFSILHDGEAVPGFIQKMGPATRLQRDEVTGEELPTAEEDAVFVLGATLVFPFTAQPDSLTLMAPAQTGRGNIGFVLYHLGIAVNDFRYLSPGYTVNLDWEDPWYSAFNAKALKRQYLSPMTGFIYVEPFEVRKEIILRPKDIQQWVDLGLEGQDVIRADQQQEIKRKVVEFLEPHFPVKIDGQPVQGTVDRVNFLRRTLRSSTVVDGQDIDLLSSTMGVIYVFPTGGLPQTVEMDWDVFTDKMQRVPVASVDQAGPLPAYMEPDYTVLKWENFLKHPDIPSLVDIQPPPTALQRMASWGQWLMLAFAILALSVLIRARMADRKMPAIAMLGALLAFASAAFLAVENHRSRLDPDGLQQLTGNLLHNVYRAFDYRGEEVIYDVLANSASGDLLTDIYLETRRGLELANQGGARVKVKDIEMIETSLLDSHGNSFQVVSRWNVSGSVGHWGHIHQRRNAYHARLEISELDGVWKLTGLEILEEERL